MPDKEFMKIKSDNLGVAHIQVPSLLTDAYYTLGGLSGTILTDTSLPGLSGFVGNTGATGATGATGPIGPTGNQGNDGNLGNTGLTGPTGVSLSLYTAVTEDKTSSGFTGASGATAPPGGFNTDLTLYNRIVAGNRPMLATYYQDYFPTSTPPSTYYIYQLGRNYLQTSIGDKPITLWQKYKGNDYGFGPIDPPQDIGNLQPGNYCEYLSNNISGSLAGCIFTNTSIQWQNTYTIQNFNLNPGYGLRKRCFAGYTSSPYFPTDVEPSTMTNCVGIGFGASDTTWHLYCSGTTPQPPIPLAFANDPHDSIYSPYMQVKLNMTIVEGPSLVGCLGYEISDVNSNPGIISGLLTVAQQPDFTHPEMPFGSTLYSQIWVSSATLTPVEILIGKQYTEQGA